MPRGWRYNRGQTEGEAEDPNEFLPPGSVGEEGQETMQSEQGEIQSKAAHIEELLEQLSLTELNEVIELANEHRLNREMEARELLLKEFRERAGQMGFQFEALFLQGGPSRRRNAGVPLTPKYRSPSGELYSGRGVSPRWLQAMIAEGNSKEDFFIQPDGTTRWEQNHAQRAAQ